MGNNSRQKILFDDREFVVAGSSSSNLDIAAAWATIATFGAVLFGGAVYAIGACWLLKLYVIKIEALRMDAPAL